MDSSLKEILLHFLYPDTPDTLILVWQDSGNVSQEFLVPRGKSMAETSNFIKKDFFDLFRALGLDSVVK